MASPRTRSGTPKLSDLARLVVAPSGITSTGWPGVRDTCRTKMGVSFDPWQDGAGRLILAKRKDGKLAATIGGVGMALPRQVGKTYLIGALVFALCINNPGLLVIWTAHHARTHGETFLSMQGFAQRHKVAPWVEQVFKGSGDEEIRFVNGSRILFGARERGFGRGIPGVDVLIFDEAQILSDRALDAMLATMNTSALGLHLYIGTPPRPEDNSETFVRMRTEAWSGQMEDSAWIEFGADDGYVPTPKPAPLTPADWKQVAKANPSHPRRTPRESILRLRKKLSDESFLREGLGIWDSTSRASVFGAGHWEAVPRQERPVGLALGCVALAVSIDLEKASVVGAGQLEDRAAVKVLQHGPAPDLWLVRRAVELHERHGVPVVIDGKGPGADFVPDLQDALGDALHVAQTGDVLDACAGIYKTVRAKGLVRLFDEADVDDDGALGPDELDAAVRDAVKRDVGDRWAWGRRKSGTDISPVEGMTLAVWGLENSDRPAESAYEDRGVLTI